MPLTRTTRRALIGGALAAPLVLAGAGAAYVASGPGSGRAPRPDAAPPNGGPVSVRLGPDLRLHMIQTGWVAVKRPHRAFAGPDGLGLPAILAARRWTEWMPIYAWLIEHPEGLILVDTGESAQANAPGYLDCDPGSAWFYGANLRFGVRPGDEVGAQLRALGFDPARVGRVVMTHRHGDHIGGMSSFPQAEFLISAVDFGGHVGAVPCREPAGLRRSAVAWDGPAAGPFAASRPLTADGRVAVVPAPGHTPGHQAVWVAGAARAVLIAGDAAFSAEQVAAGEMAGIAADPRAARATLGVLGRAQAAGVALLFAHDPGNAARLIGA